MKQIIYDSAGNILSTTDTVGAGITYNRLDIGVLLLNQAFPTGPNIYDFRVPGDSNNNTFRYRFPRDGYVLGVTMTGTVSATVSAGAYVSRYDHVLQTYSDVMQPSDAGNQQTFDMTNLPKAGIIIMAPTPIPYKKDDLAAMKFSTTGPVTVSLAGFLLVGLVPQ